MARSRVIALGVALAVAVSASCRPDGGERASAPTTTEAGSPPVVEGEDEPAIEDPVPEARRGGSIRVAVWGAPDPAAATLGGAAVRALALPQLFFAKPDGRWGPLLVEPGSDRAAPDRRSASFRIREGAAWSDGAPITAEDLRRSADPRFVAGVEGPAPDRTITVRFTQPLPGWRRLWSATESISAPRDGVWGGPFAVVSTVPGLETVLRPNPGWRGQGPFLDELRLVLVPDATVARQLLARGEVDVVAPLADTRRSEKLRGTPGVALHSTAAAGGWWVGLFLNATLGSDVRRAVAATVDRDRFVTLLLDGEAVRFDGFGGPEDASWAGIGWPAGGADALRPLDGTTVDLVGQVEEPLAPLLHRAMQKRARGAGGRLELRAAEADRVEPWLREGDYEAAIVATFDSPAVCWSCRWGAVDEHLARAADAGDAEAVSALEAKLARELLVVPLWRPRAVVAWRDGVVAPLRANPFGLSAAWDAWRWHAP